MFPFWLFRSQRKSAAEQEPGPFSGPKHEFTARQLALRLHALGAHSKCGVPEHISQHRG